MNNILNRIGTFGNYQKRILCIIGSITTLVAIVTYASVFNNAVPKVTCTNRHTGEVKDSASFCEIWNKTQPSEAYDCKNDETYYGSSIVTQWNLYCDQIYLTSFSQTLFMIGALFSFVSGSFSDKYGRKTACVVMATLLSSSLTLCGILQHPFFGLNEIVLFDTLNAQYVVYAVTQFMLGFTSFTLYVVGYILLMEISSPEKSMLMSVININIYVLGELLLLVLCYYFRDWQVHNWVICVYSYVIFALVIIYLPESPKFLIANKRYKEAADILTTISEVNGTNILISEKDILVEVNNSGETSQMITDKAELSVEEKERSENETSVLYYLANPFSNSLKATMLAYLFVSLSMIYFGIGLGITQISQSFNPYFMYLLSSIAEFIGYSAGLLDKKFSRKSIMITSLGCAGVSCLSVALIPLSSEQGFTLNSFFTITSATIGKIMASCAFNLLYLYSSQVFPTGVRNTLVSYVTCAGRIGSLLSPQINLGAQLWKPLPYVIFSSNAFLSCIVVFFMPDPAKLDK